MNTHCLTVLKTRGTYSRGFSLLETIVIITVVSVTFTILGTRLLSASSTTKAQSAGDYINEQLESAHKQAINSGGVVTVRMDAPSDTVTLSGPGMNGKTVTINLRNAPFYADLLSAESGGLSQFDLSPGQAFPPQVKFSLKVGATTMSFDLFPDATTPDASDTSGFGEEKSPDEMEEEEKIAGKADENATENLDANASANANAIAIGNE